MTRKTADIVVLPVEFKSRPKPRKYGKRARKLLIEAGLQEFDASGLSSVLLVGVSFNKGDPPVLGIYGDDRITDIRAALEWVDDDLKNCRYIEVEDEDA